MAFSCMNIYLSFVVSTAIVALHFQTYLQTEASFSG